MARSKGWITIDKLATKYSKLVTAPDGKEIYEDKSGNLVDKRSIEQKQIAAEICERMVKYLHRQSYNILNHYVKIGPNHVSRQYARNKIDPEDLVGIGAIGIMKALGKYRAQEGAVFSSYATNIINNEMSKYIINKSSTVRITFEIFEKAIKILNKKTIHQKDSDKEKRTQIIELTKLIKTQRKDDENPIKIAQAIYFSIKGEYVNINGKVNKDKHSGRSYQEMYLKNLEENISDIIDHNNLSQKVKETLSKLNRREKEIIIKRFYEERTLEEVGNDYSISRERIRQIEAKALKKLRQPEFSEELRKLYKEVE
jgi:RNA polymerase primary sigma factor